MIDLSQIPEHILSTRLHDGRTHREHLVERAARAAQTHGVPCPLDVEGIRWSRPVLGDAPSRRRREIATEDQLASQIVQFAVSPGSTITLPDMTTLRQGDEVKLGEHVSPRAIVRLRALGLITTIDPIELLLRLRPKAQYVWIGPSQTIGGKKYKRGDAVTREEFPPPPAQRERTPEELARWAAAGCPPREPPMSIFAGLLHADMVRRNPYYSPQRGERKAKK